MTPELLMALRETTHELHRQIEETPLSRAILREAISRRAYATLLADLAGLHEGLEEELCRWSQRPGREALFHRGLCRASCARGDLDYLGGAGGPGEAGRGAARKILERCRGEALAGVVYVLEGSRLGSTVLCRKLSGALGLPLAERCGLDYHLHRREQLGDDFRALALGLGSIEGDHHGAVVEGAIATFEAMRPLYEQAA